MTIIIIIALAIFVIASTTIYHNTNSFQPRQRIIAIVISMVIMYLVTSLICIIKSKGITVQNKNAINDTLNVVKMIFTPINAMIVVAPLGNLLGKIKDKAIESDKVNKRLTIIIILIIIIFIFEINYIESFITYLLG